MGDELTVGDERRGRSLCVQWTLASHCLVAVSFPSGDSTGDFGRLSDSPRRKRRSLHTHRETVTDTRVARPLTAQGERKHWRRERVDDCGRCDGTEGSSSRALTLHLSLVSLARPVRRCRSPAQAKEVCERLSGSSRGGRSRSFTCAS